MFEDMRLLGLGVDYGVLGVLLFMSFLVVFAWIERMIFFAHVEVTRYEFRDELELELSKKLSMIGSIASNAPYIGLLGTVLSIMLTFYTLREGGVDSASIMNSLSLALKATAGGLIVAIPSTMIYNHLNRRIDVLLVRYDVEQKRAATKLS